ncbi:MAG: penicillin-binding protein activator [Pseudomonadota bacterium]
MTARTLPSLRKRRLATLCLIASAALVAGCETTDLLGGSVSATTAERDARAGRHEDAASAYIELAGRESGDTRNRYMLLAARQWLLAGDTRRAKIAWAGVDEPLSQPLRNDWLVTQAALHVSDGDGDSALAALAAADTASFNLNQRIVAEGVRGEALFLTDAPVAALETMQRRELWLNSPEEIAAHHAIIWDGLLQSDPQTLRAALTTARNNELRGWLALGLLADGSLPGGPMAGVAAWQRQYPGHPALEFIIPGISSTDSDLAQGDVNQVALLLTLTGRAGIVGQAVRDGFLVQYAERYADSVDAPTVRIYDVGELGATLAYQRALEDGADFIVGPVLRSPVDELGSSGTLSERTLLLNYLPRDNSMLTAGYQFGLAPEDEARAAAQRAYMEGHRRALALVPASNWGDRVLNAFNEAFTALGGELLAYQNYEPAEADYKNEIQSMMLINDSVARYREMRSTLGGTLQFEPRIRADADFIFLGATNDSAKRIKPQLRFHYAGDLPVIATSAVYNPRTKTPSNDLAGIRFNDIRWLIDRFAAQDNPLARYEGDLTAARTQPRLFALGFDALDVMQRVTSDQSELAPVIPGATGDLIISANGRIERTPLWAEFVRGDSPRPLTPLTLPEGMLDRASFPATESDFAPSTEDSNN